MDDARNQLAGKMLSSLPKYSSWVSKLQYFQTPYGRLGLRSLGVLYVMRHEDLFGDATTPSSLADYLDVQPSVVTRALTRLEEGGFIERTMDRQDRRRINITMTEKGHAVSVYVEEMYLREMVRSMHHIDDQDILDLLAAIDTLDTILTDLEARGASIFDPASGDALESLTEGDEER
jgi:DNA-binding MarR family transcriptional regulator